MLSDTLGRSGPHLLDDLLGVLIEELVHCLSDDVVAVQLIHDSETRSAQVEVNQESRYPHVPDTVTLFFHSLHSCDC